MPNPDASAAVERAMRALLAQRADDLAQGATGVGWKIGFDTPAIQQHFGLHDAVVGYLTDTRVVAPGATVSLAGWAAPAVEVELAVRVGADGTVAGLGPALELVDLDISFGDIELVLSGNVCHRNVVFGAEVTGVDPMALAATVIKDGTVVAEGRLTKDPTVTTAFVRAYLAAHGAVLEPGQRIICGSVVPPVAVAPGDALDVSFGPFGSLAVRFDDSG
ncbi:MAG TPA: fumarylacetoacetate hydrolase family protein [Acidimicrobiales bacterium]|nr:fumarylacetoacetate hydrolase family protein [Acidimicrobiales bacterium]